MESQNKLTESTLVATATAYLDAISDLNPSLLSSLLSEEYKHEFAPASAALGSPVGGEKFISRFEALRDVLRGYPITIKRVSTNLGAKQVIVWATGNADFHPHVRNEEDVWSFQGEYMFMFTMNASGDKVEHTLEFVDSQSTMEMRAMIAHASQRMIQTELCMK